MTTYIMYDILIFENIWFFFENLAKGALNCTSGGGSDGLDPTLPITALI